MLVLDGYGPNNHMLALDDYGTNNHMLGAPGGYFLKPSPENVPFSKYGVPSGYFLETIPRNRPLLKNVQSISEMPPTYWTPIVDYFGPNK